MKRGQVTVFVILGIIVIIAVILGFVLRKSFTESAAEAETKEIISFADEVREVRKHVEDCMGQALEDSVPYFSNKNIPDYDTYLKEVAKFVSERTEVCLKLSQFANLKITKEDITIETVMDEKRTLLSATAMFDVKIERNGEQETLSEFHAEVPLRSRVYGIE